MKYIFLIEKLFDKNNNVIYNVSVPDFAIEISHVDRVELVNRIKTSLQKLIFESAEKLPFPTPIEKINAESYRKDLTRRSEFRFFEVEFEEGSAAYKTQPALNETPHLMPSSVSPTRVETDHVTEVPTKIAHDESYQDLVNELPLDDTESDMQKLSQSQLRDLIMNKPKPQPTQSPKPPVYKSEFDPIGHENEQAQVIDEWKRTVLDLQKQVQELREGRKIVKTTGSIISPRATKRVSKIRSRSQPHVSTGHVRRNITIPHFMDQYIKDNAKLNFSKWVAKAFAKEFFPKRSKK